MKTLAARENPESEAPFRAPEAFAFAMPLIAVCGLIVVVSAVALGASGPVVALVAVGGFGLCALAPMALIEAFVNRPLRGAAAQLRAARDGRTAHGPAFASGVLADLVHIARDLQAAQANLGPTALSPFEVLVAASEEAARGLRDQAESVAEAAADGESQINRAAQACFADIARAIQSLRDAPVATGFDSAVERLEAMLVYIAETQERAEAKDRQFEGAFGRVEIGMADVARLVARETETVQGALSSASVALRSDLADTVAQEKGARTRVLERLDTLETRLAKGADGVAAEVVRLGEALRPSLTPLSGKLEALAAALARIEAAKPAEDSPALGAAAARWAEPVEAGIADLRAELRETAAQIETLRVPAGLDELRADLSRQIAEIGARLGDTSRDDLARELAQAARGLIEAKDSDEISAKLADIAARLASGDATALQRLDALGGELKNVAQAVAAQDGRPGSETPDAFMRATENLGAVARRLEAFEARLAAQSEGAKTLAETVESALAEVAVRTEAAAHRHNERLDDFAEETLDPARNALTSAIGDLAAARARLGAGDPALARAVEALRTRLDALAESLPGALADKAETLAARFDAAALAPARDALAQAAENLDAAQGRFAAAVEKIEAGDPRLAALTETLRAQGEDLASRFDAAALAPARDALAQAADSFAAAQARLALAVDKIEAGDPRLAVLTETLRAQGEDLASRLDAAALTPARDALAQAADSFAAAQGRLAAAAQKFEAGDPRLDSLAESLRAQGEDLAFRIDAAARAQLTQAHGDVSLTEIVGATDKLQSRIGDLVEAVRSQGDDLAARLDASALNPARDAFTQATQSFAAAQTRLTQAVAKVEAGDPRLAQVGEAAKALRADFAALAQNLPEALGATVAGSGLVPARDALNDAARAFDAARSRLDDGAESWARLRGDFVASEARFGRMLEETVARLAALGLERLPDLVGEMGAAQAQWRALLGEFERSAAALSNGDAQGVAALRDAFAAAERTLRADIVALEASAAAQAERIVQALETRDRAGALELGQATAALADLHARWEPALTQAQNPEALDALIEIVAASAESLSGRFDESTQMLARKIEERVESLRRGDFATAASALQAAAQDIGKAQAQMFVQADALKGTLIGDRSAFTALRQDLVQTFASVAALGERTDASIRDAAHQTEALATSVGKLAGAESTELAALAQALGRIGERVEYAARAFEDRRGGDLVTLGADLTREIDALARATAERVLALEGGVETLAHAAGATLTQVREATRAFSGAGLEKIVSRLDPLAELPALTQDLRAILAQAPSGDGWRPALDALGARLAQIEAALVGLGSQLTGGHDADALASALSAASRVLQTSLPKSPGEEHAAPSAQYGG